MADNKSDLISDFGLEVRHQVGRWNDLAEVYGQKYDEAYSNYRNTLERQSSRDAARAAMVLELLFVASAITGGATLIAVFGKAGLRHAAKEMAVRTICNNNMTRVFNAAAIVEANPIASFAVGKLFDSSTSAISRAGKDAIKSAVTANPMGSGGDGSSALQTYLRIRNVVTKADNAMTAAMQDILNGPLSFEDAQTAVADLRTAPLMQTPPTLDPNLRSAIELTMFLNLVMTRDVLRSAIRLDGGDGKYGWVRSGYEPITASPTSPRYPQRSHMYRGSDGRLREDAVIIKDLGGIIDDRINELHRTMFGRPLLATGFWDSLALGEMASAETSLRSLADLYRNRLIRSI